MGIRFRKSINLGKGFRINMSKTGPGFSWGGKGFRLTRTANGNIRGSAYLPGTGLSYVKEIKDPLSKTNKDVKGKKTKSKKNDEQINLDNLEEYKIDFDSINSTGLDDLVRAYNSESPYRSIGMFIFIIGLILAFMKPILILVSVVGSIFYFANSKKENMEIEYDFTDEADGEYELTDKLLEGILESDMVWIVSQLGHKNDKNFMLARDQIVVDNDLPRPITTNIKVKTLRAKDYTFTFLPDALLIGHKARVKAINYEDLEIDLRADGFVELGDLVPDATLIEKTYMFTNKDGSPDKRYKKNPEANIVEYGILEIHGQGLNLFIVFSDTMIDGK